MVTTLYTTDASIRGSCITQLLFMGFNVLSCDKIEKVNKILKEEKVDCLLIDIDDKENNWIDFVKKIKHDEVTSGLFIIAISSLKNQLFINNFIMESGVNAIFYKNQSFADSLHKITPVLMNYNKQKEKRKFHRVIPAIDDILNAEFHINGILNNGHFSGKVIDISPVGIAISLDNKYDMDHIKANNTYINKLTILINNEAYICDGFVLRKKNDILAIKYLKTDNSFRSGIAEYISQRMIY